MAPNLIEVKRTYRKKCTTAEWTIDGAFICFTIERPWLSNEPFESCVPAGDYDLMSFESDDHPKSFYLENKNLGVSLKGKTTRTAILVHIGNWVEDVVGCFAPGLTLMASEQGDGEFMVGNSSKAMKLLNKLITDDKKWTLRVT